MNAVILAAGRGNRMRPLTDEVHKTLIPVGGPTIIESIVDSLVDNDIANIVVVTGYLEADLRDFLATRYPAQAFEFIPNPRWAETNNIYSLGLALEALASDDDVLLIESDLVYDPAVLRRCIESPFANVALVDRFRTGMDGTVVTVDNKVITNIIPPHLQGPAFDFSDKYKTLNIYKFSGEFVRTTFQKLLSYYAKVIDANSYYESILGVLIYMQRETIHAEIVEGQTWAEIDDPNDLRIAEFTFDESKQLGILESSFGGFWNYDVIDFGFICNQYFPNDSMLSEMRANLPALLKNYGSKQDVLNQKLAYFLLMPAGRVNATNGASQAFPLLKEYVGSRRVLLPSPTFGEFSRMWPSAETYSDEVGVDEDEVEAKAADADVVVFVNPNSPTGSWVSTRWIHDFARRHPANTVLVDESFVDFGEGPSITSLIEAEPVENIIVVKSLSKCLGVPGVRLGYLYSANTAFNAFVRDRLPVWNLNSMAEYLLETILKHRPSLAASYRQTIQDRAALADGLSRCAGVSEVFPSAGNFVLVRLDATPTEATQLAARLLSGHRIYVKSVTGRFPDDHAYLRIAVRLPQENAGLLAALGECRESVPGPARTAIALAPRARSDRSPRRSGRRDQRVG